MKVPIFSALVLFFLFLPFYLVKDPAYYPLYVLGHGVAYFSAYRWRVVLLWPIAVLTALAVWSVWGPAGVLVLLLVYNAVFYLMALVVGSGVCRAVSLASFWVFSQLAPFVVSLPLAALGYRFSLPLPAPWEYPLYVALYAFIYYTHGRLVKWCHKRRALPPPSWQAEEILSRLIGAGRRNAAAR